MANDFELRLKSIEDREAILYGYIDELRRWTVELRQEIAEMRVQIVEMRVQTAEMRQEHKDSRKRIAQNEEVTATVVQPLGLILRILERMDQKLDDLGKPGRNGGFLAGNLKYKNS